MKAIFTIVLFFSFLQSSQASFRLDGMFQKLKEIKIELNSTSDKEKTNVGLRAAVSQASPRAVTVPKVVIVQKKAPVAPVRRPVITKPKLTLEPQITVRTTAYTHSEYDHIDYGRKTAVGTTLKYGETVSCAADWSVFPYGTKFKIQGDERTYFVEDYGSALVGTRTIDIYKPSMSSMNNWGVRHVPIKIIEMGNKQKSIDILKTRTKYKHCRAMLADLS